MKFAYDRILKLLTGIYRQWLKWWCPGFDDERLVWHDRSYWCSQSSSGSHRGDICSLKRSNNGATVIRRASQRYKAQGGRKLRCWYYGNSLHGIKIKSSYFYQTRVRSLPIQWLGFTKTEKRRGNGLPATFSCHWNNLIHTKSFSTSREWGGQK